VIVTAEEGQNSADIPWKRPKIPTVARIFNIDCKNLFEFMKAVGGF
jgi:hypothetical protein